MVWFFFFLGGGGGGFEKDLRISIFFWIWNIFLDVSFLCWFKKDFSIWDVFRFEKKLLIWKIVVDMKNITRSEKMLLISKTFVELWKIYCERPFLSTVEQNFPNQTFIFSLLLFFMWPTLTTPVIIFLCTNL